MSAMGEEGPFIMIGSMDAGDVRAYQFALDHPDKVVAVVSASMSGVSEFGTVSILCFAVHRSHHQLKVSNVMLSLLAAAAILRLVK
jgi:hypothetical protein